MYDYIDKMKWLACRIAGNIQDIGYESTLHGEPAM